MRFELEFFKYINNPMTVTRLFPTFHKLSQLQNNCPSLILSLCLKLFGFHEKGIADSLLQHTHQTPLFQLYLETNLSQFPHFFSLFGSLKRSPTFIRAQICMP